MSASQRRRDTEQAEMARHSPSPRVSLLFFLLSLTPDYFLSSSALTPFKDVGLDKPILHLHLASSLNDGNSCDRVRITGLSRLDLKSYASSHRVSLNVSESVPERLHGKINVCFHRNASLGLCQCEKDEWQVLQKGQWSAALSPYETRYIDVKFKDKASGSITVSTEEEFQRWRLVCLGIGFLLLLSAPIVSNWVPFYYSSSMALGVLLVVLLILFQGMKLLPMGRKNVLYLTLYGSLLGVGSFIAHYFSTVVNSILVNFGLSEEMHNPVSVFLLVGIVLAGAALGYWIVRKYVLSEDGGVYAGIAQFVKWAMRVIAVFFIFQSTLDALLAVVALCTSWCICFSMTSRKWWSPVTSQQTHMTNLWLQRTRQAEFLSRSPRREIVRNIRASPNSAHVWSGSPTTGLVYSSPNKKLAHQHENHFSTFHKTPTPRKFSRNEWEDFTRESTSEALAEWSSTPEVAKWLADNALRMRLVNNSNSEDSMESSSGSSEETAVENGSGLNLFHNWY